MRKMGGMPLLAALTLLVTSLGPAVAPASEETPPAVAEPVPEPASAPSPAPAERERELEFHPGVQIWLRGQARRNPDFSSETPPLDTVDVLSRVRLSASIRWRMLHAFAQAQDHRSWGGQEETTTPPFGMHQGYAELDGERGKAHGSIRLGRQEVAWGRQRILGPLPWAAAGRSLDAVRILGGLGMVELELLAAMIERPRTFTVEDVSVHTRGVTLGAMRLGIAPHDAVHVELMALVDRAGPSPAQLQRDRLVADAGVHVFGEPVKKVLTYDVEAHGQLGRWSGLPHRAWAFASLVRAQLPEPKAHPGLHLGYAMGSGNVCTGEPGTTCSPTGTSREFFNFHPTNHPPYGNLDLNDWSNLRDLEAGLFVREDAGFEVSAIHHSFWMDDPRGTWTDSGSRLVATGWDPANTERHLGHELDVILTYTPWPPLMIQPGYGFFVPGAAARRIAGNDAQHFVYLWMVLTFP
jgi:hypothetical protein